MSNFQLFEMAWKNSWIGKFEMNDAVKYGILTKEEFIDITGYPYE